MVYARYRGDINNNIIPQGEYFREKVIKIESVIKHYIIFGIKRLFEHSYITFVYR